MNINDNVEYIIKDKLPKHAYIYQNIFDSHHYEEHFKKFKEYVIFNNITDNFSLIEFENKNSKKNPHIDIIPENETIEKILENII